MIIPRSVFHRVRNVSDKNCIQNQNTHFVFRNVSPDNRAVCEIMWECVVERGRLQMAIWRTRVSCWTHKATNTNTDYVNSLIFTATMVAGTRLIVTWGVQQFIYLSRKEGNERNETSLCVLGHVLRCHICWDMS